MTFELSTIYVIYLNGLFELHGQRPSFIQHSCLEFKVETICMSQDFEAIVFDSMIKSETSGLQTDIKRRCFHQIINYI